MADKTKIQWTATVNADGSVTPGSTWNPVRGCSRVSEGCRNCYAESVAARFSGKDPEGKPLPYYGLARQGDHGPRWTGKVVMVPEHLDDPIRWKRPRRIFVNSMSDLFQDKLTDDEIARVFRVMLAAPRHTYQVLTKRAERMRRWVNWFAAERGEHLPPNIWLGVSAEDQKNADERIPELLDTRASVRFVSAEPLLGPINFHPWLCRYRNPSKPEQRLANICSPRDHGIDWIIVGGESGRNARPFDVEWAREIVRQCHDAGAAPFVKQLGAKSFDSTGAWQARSFQLHGPEIEEWAPDFAVREFPSNDVREVASTA